MDESSVIMPIAEPDIAAGTRFRGSFHSRRGRKGGAGEWEVIEADQRGSYALKRVKPGWRIRDEFQGAFPGLVTEDIGETIMVEKEELAMAIRNDQISLDAGMDQEREARQQYFSKFPAKTTVFVRLASNKFLEGEVVKNKDGGHAVCPTALIGSWKEDVSDFLRFGKWEFIYGDPRLWAEGIKRKRQFLPPPERIAGTPEYLYGEVPKEPIFRLGQGLEDLEELATAASEEVSVAIAKKATLEF